MKSTALAANMLLTLLLAACASTPLKEPAKVTTAAAPVPAAPPKAPETTPVPQQPVAINPLKDPNNILSKRNVYFDFDQSIVKDDYRDLIKAHAQYLMGHSDTKVRLEGHADERGSREYNLALGQRRAEAVREAMTILGASGSHIDTMSYGKEKPVCTEHEESCWWRNRRTEIIYQGEK